MKKLLFLLLVVVLFSSHDMFLKLDTYFLQPNTAATIVLVNGTFAKSENVIDRNRMIDVSLIGSGERFPVDTTQWSEKEEMTLLDFQTGEAGTWVAGVSTRARNIEMAAASFNDYLAHDGITDMLDWRKKNDALKQDAVEKYAKHVKTIFQVGDKTSDDWQTALGYPIEFVPLSNPYKLHVGDALPVQLLLRGEPLANQIVTIDAASMAHDHAHAEDHDHDHDHAEEDHQHDDGTQVRTDAEGKLSVKLSQEGIWYLRTIHLVESTAPGLTHESNWATLTFEIGHGHSHDDEAHTHADGTSHGHDHAGENHGNDHDHGDGDHDHSHGDGDHDHDHDEGGIPISAFLIASLVLVGVLFAIFNQKS